MARTAPIERPQQPGAAPYKAGATFADFMNVVLRPGVLKPNLFFPVTDVRLLSNMDPGAVEAIDNHENDWLSWLEEAPRNTDSRQQNLTGWLDSHGRA